MNFQNYEEAKQGEFLLIDKPRGWSSFDVVKKVRALLQHHYGVRKIKVGHAGTLDPAATGLLILCTGKMTKEIEKFQGEQKAYEGVFKLGATTPSLDSETEEEAIKPYQHITKEKLNQATEKFKGTIDQMPPDFSAKKIGGVPAYVKARKGKEVILKENTVTIHDFTLGAIDLPQVDFQVKCSKGTYIRSLAKDFGEELGTGAYLKELRRNAIGPYTLDQAFSVEGFESMVKGWEGKSA